MNKIRISRRGVWYIIRSQCFGFEEQYITLEKAYRKAATIYRNSLL